MFIPFAGHWINPAHITRMAYFAGKRLTISLADGQPSLTEYATSIVQVEGKKTPDVDVDEKFKRIISAPLAFAVAGPTNTATIATMGTVTIQGPDEPPAAAAVTVNTPKPPTPPARSRKR